MIAPPLAIALVLLTLFGLTAGLKAFERLARPHAELTRKLMHVGMGLVVLTFPWLFDRQWPVQLLAGVATAMLLAVKFLPRFRDGIGSVVSRVKRPTLGEVYFPVAVGVLFWLSGGDALLFCVPMLILTLADAVAALVGLAYGRARYVTRDGFKSVEGSLAFLAVAFLSVHVPLLLSDRTGRAESLLIAATIALLSALIEAVAWRGLDNLAIPLGAFAFLSMYQDKSAADLTVRLLATMALMAFALPWRRRSSLDDGALLGCVLFGYGVWMLGGCHWLVGPAVLFTAHAVFWPCRDERREHSVFALLPTLVPALLWLALFVAGRQNVWFLAYAVTFGLSLAMAIICGLNRQSVYGRIAVSMVAGGLLAVLQFAAYAAWYSNNFGRDEVTMLLIAVPLIAIGVGFVAWTERAWDRWAAWRQIVMSGIGVAISLAAVALARFCDLA